MSGTSAPDLANPDPMNVTSVGSATVTVPADAKPGAPVTVELVGGVPVQAPNAFGSPLAIPTLDPGEHTAGILLDADISIIASGPQNAIKIDSFSATTGVFDLRSLDATGALKDFPPLSSAAGFTTIGSTTPISLDAPVHLVSSNTTAFMVNRPLGPSVLLQDATITVSGLNPGDMISIQVPIVSTLDATPAAVTPEPASVIVFVAILLPAGLYWRRRRRHKDAAPDQVQLS